MAYSMVRLFSDNDTAPLVHISALPCSRYTVRGAGALCNAAPLLPVEIPCAIAAYALRAPVCPCVAVQRVRSMASNEIAGCA